MPSPVNPDQEEPEPDLFEDQDPEFELMPGSEMPHYAIADAVKRGRPKGSKGPGQKLYDAMARSWAPAIIDSFCRRALDPKDMFSVACGKIILNHVWPKPLPTLELDLTADDKPNFAAIVYAIVKQLAKGNLDPALAHDVATVVSLASKMELAGSIAAANGDNIDARKKLADKLAALVRNRQRQNGSSPEEPPEEEPIITPPPATANTGIDLKDLDLDDLDNLTEEQLAAKAPEIIAAVAAALRKNG